MNEIIKQVDLGCGGAKRLWQENAEYIGVDITNVGTCADVICNLGFDDIPLPDHSADVITAYDILEHIPFCTWIEKKPSGKIERLTPIIKLFNEIYRVLKPGGIFYCQVPVYPNREIFQDPTHVSFWTDETINYFSGDYYGFHDTYAHTSRFKKYRPNRVEGSHLKFELIALPQSDDPYLV